MVMIVKTVQSTPTVPVKERWETIKTQVIVPCLTEHSSVSVYGGAFMSTDISLVLYVRDIPGKRFGNVQFTTNIWLDLETEVLDQFNRKMN